MKDFEGLLKNYIFNANENQIKSVVKKIIDEHYENNDTTAALKLIFSCLEITSLQSTDNENTIASLVEKINLIDEKIPELPKLTGICVYPISVETVKSLLTEEIGVTSVIGFPSSQTFTAVKLAESALAIADGATEIDMVLPVGQFLIGNYDYIFDEIQEIKATVRESTLKVILETSLLNTYENIFKASIIAMEAGADYIKTSTGKEGPTDIYSVYTMCLAIKAFYEKTGIQHGIKIAGGVNTTQDALLYYTIIKDVLGEEWLNNEHLRFGASRLANKLISGILKEENNYF
ncbi:MAG: deoxyribose-phosphate aldolase [Bacteroidia bacterium]|nr:deoxyribose-phosphate aldolase [Bacteroidia bacterium]